MRSIPRYPVWLSAFMILGPFFMVGATSLLSKSLILVLQMAGAAMVIIAMFYVSKRLHEQMEEVAALRSMLSAREPERERSPQP